LNNTNKQLLCGLHYKHVTIVNELSVSDATILSVTPESSITILETSFTLIYDVYSTGVTYDDHQSYYILQATGDSSKMLIQTGSGLNHRGYTRLKMLARVKHSLTINRKV
jgi:hypothetical protein